jgi:effector-binding domain-containing protein
MSRTEALRVLTRRQTYRHEAELVRVVAELRDAKSSREVFARHPALGVDAQMEACKRAETLRALSIL